MSLEDEAVAELKRVTLEEEVTRLRALIKSAEWSGWCVLYPDSVSCPWCEANCYAQDRAEEHEPDCVAFFPNGEVR